MATSTTKYLGELRSQATHIQSGKQIITDAPLDNEGRGEAFSPTDLLATSLSCCMLTIMGIAAGKHGFSIEGTQVVTTKIMAQNPRRVGEIVVEFTFPQNNYDQKTKKLIEAAARECPVAKSLHPDLRQTIVFNY
jgi:putative redox protein